MDIADIRLTRTERTTVLCKVYGITPRKGCLAPETKADEALANTATDKAIEKILEYEDEPCKNEHHASGRYFYATHGYYCHKHNCQECRQALKELVKNEKEYKPISDEEFDDHQMDDIERMHQG